MMPMRNGMDPMEELRARLFAEAEELQWLIGGVGDIPLDTVLAVLRAFEAKADAGARDGAKTPFVASEGPPVVHAAAAASIGIGWAIDKAEKAKAVMARLEELPVGDEIKETTKPKRRFAAWNLNQ